MKLKAQSRVPVGTAVKEEIYKRILILRDHGFTVPDILILGIQAAEKKVKKIS